MRLSVSYQFAVSGVPARCRNERESTFLSSRPLEIEIPEASSAQCPVAIVLDHRDPELGDPTELRMYDGRLWRLADTSPERIGFPHEAYAYSRLPEFDAHQWRRIDTNTEAEVERTILEHARGYLLIDGALYEQSGEPRYHVHRTGFRTYGISQTNAYLSEDYRDYFRADDLCGAQMYAASLAEREDAKYEAEPDILIRVCIPTAVTLNPVAEWKARFAPSPTRIADLERQHSFYGDYNQRERNDCRYLAEHGHPNAAAYQHLRAFFDTLRYGANSSSRYYTYINERENSYYNAPELRVRWTTVYPAMGDKYDAWLADVCAHGFTESHWDDDRRPVEPYWDAGYWAIDAISGGPLDVALRALGYRRQNNGFQIFLHDEHEFARVKTVIDAYHLPQGAISQRTAVDDEADNAPLPMSQKRFTLGGVKKVAVLPRMVMVPLIPLGVEFVDYHLEIVNDLLRCVADGLNQDAEVEKYLEIMLKPEAVERAMREAKAVAGALACSA